MEFTITLDDKPKLTKALQENPALVREVIGTFVWLMEDAFDESNGIRWADLPKQFDPSLTFNDLIRGILHGSLDLKGINPDAYDALKVEVHPLSMLQPRKNYLDGGVRYTNWRNHFRLPAEVAVNEDTIAKIFRTMLRHNRFIKIEQLRQHLEANQVVTYRGLGDAQMEKLPFYPALQYQKKLFGDLGVGKFYENVGFFDCGEVAIDETNCPACLHDDLKHVGGFKVCEACNAGYRKISL